MGTMDAACSMLSPLNESLEKDFIWEDSTTVIDTQFSVLYKALEKNKESSQSERRQRFLQELKKRRNDFIDEKRDIFGLNDAMEAMEIDTVAKNKTKKRKYPYRLMFTEWLCEVPDDLQENWFVKFCPYGKRCLVVAEKYNTACYNRKGVQMGPKFESLLPGGSCASQRNKFTMLECLYSYDLKCYFVVDVLYWNSMPMHKYDVEFRFYWLQSKFMETPELSQKSEHNKQQFYLLEHIPAIPDLISDKLNVIPQLNGVNFLYDGLLFYHKESIYISGFTPLVIWLKPCMIPEVLSVTVNACYMEKVPKGYINFKEFVKKLTSLKQGKDKVSEVEMVTEETK